MEAGKLKLNLAPYSIQNLFAELEVFFKQAIKQKILKLKENKKNANKCRNKILLDIFQKI